MYEGEGWLCPKRKDPKKQWSLGLKSTDYDVIKVFHSVVQVGNLCGPYHTPTMKPHHKPYWQLNVYKKEAIFKVICDFYPYVGERRRAKFDEFLTHHYGN